MAERNDLAKLLRDELGWDWNRSLPEHIPSAEDMTLDIADAILAAGWHRPNQASDDAFVSIFAEALDNVPPDITHQGARHYWIEGYCAGREATS